MSKRIVELEAQPTGDKNTDEIKLLKARLNQSEFYKDNPDYEPYREMLGDNPAEKIKDQGIKDVLSKAIEHDKSEGNKSVLKSNPRLGQVTDKMTKAREFSKEGSDSAANKSAIGAVLDAYEG